MHAEALLAAYRACVADEALPAPDDLSAIGVPLGSVEAIDGLSEADRNELWAYDALAQRRPGWAFVCSRAAAEHHADEGRTGAEERLRALSRRVLVGAFPGFAQQVAAMLDLLVTSAAFCSA